MAKKRAGDVVVSRDRYRQTRVVREEELIKPEKEWVPPPKPSISKGDTARCTLFSVHYDIPEPCTILDVLPDKRFNSGWAVSIETRNKGVIELDSMHFIKVK